MLEAAGPGAAPRVVLMTTDTVGGVWTYSIELARALAPARVLVVLAAMGGRAMPSQRAEARLAGNIELHDCDLRLEWMSDPWDDVLRAGDWLLGIAARVRPDVVHLNNYCHGALPWPAPTVMVGHSCVLSWYRAVRHEDAPPEWDRYREEVTRGLGSSRRVIAPTRAMLDALARHYGPLPPSEVIANARDPERFRPVPPSMKAPFVMAAGRLWDEAKNLRTLEAAALRMTWPVRVAGPIDPPAGECGDAPRRPRRDDTPTLRLLGKLSTDEIAALLARAAIYAHPARYEPFGLSVLEAALSGCALVLGDIASLRELWQGAAEFVPPNDPDALAIACNALARDPTRRARMASAARERALAFTPARMAARYLAVYRSLRDVEFATGATPEEPCA